jgi:hypothetical protein
VEDFFLLFLFTFAHVVMEEDTWARERVNDIAFTSIQSGLVFIVLSVYLD